MPVSKSGGGSNVMFMNIVLGSLRVRHQKPIEGETETRTIESGGSKRDIHEQVFSSVTGRIEMITIKESNNDYGDEIKIVLNDGDQRYSIGTQVDGGYAANFMNRMCNVDPNKEVALTPYRMEREDKPGKYNTGISIKQEGEKIMPKFTKQSEVQLPKWEKIDLPNGKVYWDNTKTVKALIGYMAKRIYDSGLNCISVPAKWTGKGEEIKGEPVKGLGGDAPKETASSAPVGGGGAVKEMFQEKPKEEAQPVQEQPKQENLGSQYEPDDLPF